MGDVLVFGSESLGIYDDVQAKSIGASGERTEEVSSASWSSASGATGTEEERSTSLQSAADVEGQYGISLAAGYSTRHRRSTETCW